LDKEKQKNKSNFVYVGVQGFRSNQEIKDEFEGLEKEYDLEKQRKLKIYDKKYGTPLDFFTAVDSHYLLKYLLNNKNKFANKLELDGSSYKINCQKTDENNNAIEFQINFAKVDDDTICLDFKKKAGDAMAYYATIDAIKKMVETIWAKKSIMQNILKCINIYYMGREHS